MARRKKTEEPDFPRKMIALKKPALTTDQGQRQLMEAKRMLEREIATGSLKGLF